MDFYDGVVEAIVDRFNYYFQLGLSNPNEIADRIMYDRWISGNSHGNFMVKEIVYREMGLTVEGV